MQLSRAISTTIVDSSKAQMTNLTGHEDAVARHPAKPARVETTPQDKVCNS